MFQKIPLLAMNTTSWPVQKGYGIFLAQLVIEIKYFTLGSAVQICPWLCLDIRAVALLGCQCKKGALQLAQKWCVDFFWPYDPLWCPIEGMPCPFGDKCCWGHVCPNGAKCYHLSKGKCWFKGGMSGPNKIDLLSAGSIITESMHPILGAPSPAESS